MRLNRTTAAGPDPFEGWAEDLRAELLADVPTSGIVGVAAIAAGAGSASSHGIATAAFAATTYQGGTTMTATIGAATASHTAVKIAAGGVAALTASVAAVATGVVVVGVSTPAPAVRTETRVESGLTTDRGVETIEVASLGTVALSLGSEGLSVLELDAFDGVDANVRMDSTASAIVDFRSEAGTTTLFITEVDGRLVTSTTFEAWADAGTRVDAGLDGTMGVDGEAEVDVLTDVGIGADSGTLSVDGSVKTEFGAELGLGLDS